MFRNGGRRRRRHLLPTARHTDGPQNLCLSVHGVGLTASMVLGLGPSLSSIYHFTGTFC